jgi:large repetitive protein
MWNRVGLFAVSIATICLLMLGCGGGRSNNNTTTNANPPTVQAAAQNGCSNSTALTAASGSGTCGITASGGQAPYSWNVNGTNCVAGSTTFFGNGLACQVSGAGNTNFAIVTPSSAPGGRSTALTSPQRRVGAWVSSSNVTVPVNVTVMGGNGKSTNFPTFTITVTVNALSIANTPLPNGTVGVAYSASVSGSGGAPPYTWQITGLPQGLTSTGASISGTPTQSGTFTIIVTLTDSQATPVQVQVKLTLTINPANSMPLTITTSSPLPGATLGSAYPNTSITATGGTAPYTFNLASGSSLPSGLTLTSGSPSATISGTPTETGTFSFIVDVQDSASNPATAHATFSITVSGSSTLNCPATVNLTLCGTYVVAVTGGKGTQGFGAVFAVVVVNNSGHVISGEGESNDSIAGDLKFTITGGSYTMDATADGRGILSIIDSNAVVRSFHFAIQSAAQGTGGDAAEFDTTGAIEEGVLFGPEITTTPSQSSPVQPIPANTVLALPLEGVNAASQRAALLAAFQVGSSGCNGASGSFNPLNGEPIVTNTAGTVNANLSATGTCTAPDAMGVGTFTITLSGGTPYTNNTLHFTYVNGAVGSVEGGVVILESDAIGNNQPILVGFAALGATGVGNASGFPSYCPCIVHGTGTTNGTIAAHTGIAQIVRMTLAYVSGNSGTVSGVIDENAAGTITTQGTWAYDTYTVDTNGIGTFTASGQPTIHFVYGGDLYYLDEGTQVRTGVVTPQNTVMIENPGQRYISGNNAPRTLGSDVVNGVLVPSGSTAGSFSGTLDLNAEIGSTLGFAPSGTYGAPNYISLSSTTGRGTGTANLSNSSSSHSVVVYAMRHRKFLVLDVDPSAMDPFLVETQLQ